jgi:flagellar basal body-associated protein FliL
MVKRKPIQRKKQEEMNKKALIWIGVAIVVIIIIMSVLLSIYG